jgi:hypothetical protein
VQGIAVDRNRVLVTSVERATRQGYLMEFALPSGRRLRQVELQEGERYHPGGISMDGRSVWIPVAEYQRQSSTWIERRDRKTLRLIHRFAVPDHIGCVAVWRGRLYGANWDARQIYVWTRDGRLIEKRDNPGGRYQDWKPHGPWLLSGGLTAQGAVLEWLNPTTWRIDQQARLPRTDRGVWFTNEGLDARGGVLYLLPEDTPSRLFAFPLPKPPRR